MGSTNVFWGGTKLINSQYKLKWVLELMFENNLKIILLFDAIFGSSHSLENVSSNYLICKYHNLQIGRSKKSCNFIKNLIGKWIKECEYITWMLVKCLMM